MSKQLDSMESLKLNISNLSPENKELVLRLFKLFLKDDLATRSASKKWMSKRITMDDFRRVINRQYDMMTGCS